jgi:hypothetical protein
MDRDDAAFVANVLERRIAGARDDLERSAASSFARLLGASAQIRSIAGNWTAAIAAADALSAIAKRGGAVCDDSPSEDLQPFVESMKKLAAEPPPGRNRAERRRQLASLPRKQRIIGVNQPLAVGRSPLKVH